MEQSYLLPFQKTSPAVPASAAGEAIAAAEPRPARFPQLRDVRELMRDLAVRQVPNA